MTQIRPRLDEDIAVEVKRYAIEWRISFNAAVQILIRTGLNAAPRPGDQKRERS